MLLSANIDFTSLSKKDREGNVDLSSKIDKHVLLCEGLDSAFLASSELRKKSKKCKITRKKTRKNLETSTNCIVEISLLLNYQNLIYS